MQNYSLTILIKDKVDEKGRQALIDDVKKNFGNLIKEDIWGIRSLAYEIKHMDKAFYANFEFESEPQSVIALDKNIRLNEDIIRYLLIKSKKPKRVKEAQVRMQAKRAAARGEVVEASAKVEKEPLKTEVSADEVKEVKSTKRVVKIGSKKGKE